MLIVSERFGAMVLHFHVSYPTETEFGFESAQVKWQVCPFQGSNPLGVKIKALPPSLLLTTTRGSAQPLLHKAVAAFRPIYST